MLKIHTADFFYFRQRDTLLRTKEGVPLAKIGCLFHNELIEINFLFAECPYV